MSEKEKQEKTLRIFELCKELTSLLGEKEAIADLKELYDRHPEMFKDMKDVSHTIEKVVDKPDLITKAKKEEAILAIKKLSSEKMGEIAVENDNGTNIIFHTNKKRIKEFKKAKGLQVETPTPSTHHSKLAGELMSKNSSGANALSANTRSIIPQNQNQSQDYNPKDFSAMEHLREEHKEESKQEKEKAKNNQNNNYTRTYRK